MLIKQNGNKYLDTLFQVAKDMAICSINLNQIIQFVMEYGSSIEVDPLVGSSSLFRDSLHNLTLTFEN